MSQRGGVAGAWGSPLGALRAVSLLTSCLLAIAPCAASASPEATFDYLYIEANEGGSSGGHAAIRFDHDTYHFQYAPSGFVQMSRVDSSDFLTEYALLLNRSIHVSRVAVERETFDGLHRAFDRRYLTQREQLRRLEALDATRELFELAAKAARATAETEELRRPVSGAGFFAAETTGRPDLRGLKEKLARTYGRDALADRRAELGEELAVPGPELAPLPRLDLYPLDARGPSTALDDDLAAHAALDLVEAGASLRPDAIRADSDPSSALSAAELLVLRGLESTVEDRLVDLFRSRRPDWGTPFLVGMARLLVVRESIDRGSLVFLDVFPEDAPARSPNGERWREVGPLLVARAQARFDAARRHSLGRPGHREMDYARMEAAANHLMEIRAGVTRGEPIRISRDRLRPQRTALSPPVKLASPEASRDAARRTAAQAASYRDALGDLYAYQVIESNCVSTLFGTLEAGLATLAGGRSDRAIAAESAARLGGRVRPDASLAFIPFISSRHVQAQYNVINHFVIASDRNAKLAEMFRLEPDLWVHLRESNVLTSTIYERGSGDSIFLFFTEDGVVMRPIYGSVNLAVGLGSSIAGLFTSPFDRGELLLHGLKGALVSLPELVFVNIRKGSNDFVMPGGDRGDLVTRLASPPGE